MIEDDAELAALVGDATERPNDASAQYRAACAHDRAGREAAAVPFYQRTIQLGLADPSDLAGAYLGLGSTFRVLGRYAEAVQTLEEGAARFPQHGAMQVFLAMACYNAGRHEAATRLLLGVIVAPGQDETVRAYQGAIKFYADKLDQVWPG